MSKQEKLTAEHAMGVALSIPMHDTEVWKCQDLAPGVIDHLERMGYALRPIENTDCEQCKHGEHVGPCEVESYGRIGRDPMSPKPCGCEHNQDSGHSDNRAKLTNLEALQRYSFGISMNEDPKGEWLLRESVFRAARLDSEAAVSAAIAESKATIAEKNLRIAGLNGRIGSLNAVLAQRESRIKELEQEGQVWEKKNKFCVSRIQELSLENVKLRPEFERTRKERDDEHRRATDLWRATIDQAACIGDLDRKNQALAKQLQDLQARDCPEPVASDSAQTLIPNLEADIKGPPLWNVESIKRAARRDVKESVDKATYPLRLQIASLRQSCKRCPHDKS